MHHFCNYNYTFLEEIISTLFLLHSMLRYHLSNLFSYFKLNMYVQVTYKAYVNIVMLFLPPIHAHACCIIHKGMTAGYEVHIEDSCGAHYGNWYGSILSLTLQKSTYIILYIYQ